MKNNHRNLFIFLLIFSPLTQLRAHLQVTYDSNAKMYHAYEKKTKWQFVVVIKDGGDFEVRRGVYRKPYSASKYDSLSDQELFKLVKEKYFTKDSDKDHKVRYQLIHRNYKKQ